MYQYNKQKQKEGQECNSTSQEHSNIPLKIKQHMEKRSSVSLRDVKIHYNSHKPEQLQALAYTQGNQVYLGPGQEKYIYHELGHVIQQKQGRVKPNCIMNKMMLNNQDALEKEGKI